MTASNRARIWLAAAAVVVAALAGCGGAAESASPLPGPAADARNGTYQMYAADAQLYALTLDFDARSWRVQGNGVDTTGTFSASGTGFVFDPAGITPARNNARFTVAGDTIAGGFRFASGIVPFVAARAFVTTVADAAGAYKFLTRTVDPVALPNDVIFTGEIVAPSTWRMCNDPSLFTIASCPSASLVTGSLTISGDQFTANVPGASFSFRVARVGGDRVFLRASPSTGTTRRFWVGTDQQAGFDAGTFTGVNTLQQAVTTTFAATALSSEFRTEADAPSTRGGTASNAAVPGLLSITTVAEGNFFAMRTSQLAFVFAARDNPFRPGYVEIGSR